MRSTSGRDPAGFSFDTPQTSYCENGTVGWAGDTAAAKDWFSLGTGDDDGLLLVHVTLFRGKSPDVEAKPGLAQGIPVLCRVNTMFGHRIPPLGAAVLVMCDGRWELHGNPVVVAIIEKNPLVQIEDDRVVFDYGPDVHVVIKGKSVTLQDTPDGDGKSAYVSIGTPHVGGARAFYAFDETGSGFTSQSGVVGVLRSVANSIEGLIQIKDGEIDIVEMKSSMSAFKLKSDGSAWAIGTNFYSYTAGVYLGANATALTTALWGATGIAGVASTAVYIAPF